MFMYKNLQSPLRGQGLVGQRALELLACVVMSACGGSSGGSGGVSSGVVVGPIDKETTVSNWRLVPATESGLTSYFQTALGSSSAKSSWGGVWAQDVALATASTPGAGTCTVMLPPSCEIVPLARRTDACMFQSMTLGAESAT